MSWFGKKEVSAPVNQTANGRDDDIESAAALLLAGSESWCHAFGSYSFDDGLMASNAAIARAFQLLKSGATETHEQ
jgi:hypothetical protein